MTGPGRGWAQAGAQRWIRRVALGAATALSAAALTGGIESAAERWPVAPRVPVAGVPVAGSGAGTGTAVAAADAPMRVRIPAIRVDSPLEALGLDDAGALRAPATFDRAGWYAGGTAPGDIGPAVIAGHVDSRTGPAVFFRLHLLRPGDLVQVQRGDRWLAFRVVSMARYAKDRFPTAGMYGPTPDPQLRLITCGGDFDAARRSYTDNVVAYAVAA